MFSDSFSCMIEKKEIDDMIKDLNDFDNQRELLIKKSRDVLKLSKLVINCIHRGDLREAKGLARDIKTEFQELDKIAATSAELKYSGSFKVAAMEYAEAVLYYGYVTEKKIPTRSELRISPQYYILGLCDLTGELVRKAINDAIKGKMDSALEIKGVVEEIYSELLRFDFRDGEMRKKFDSVKYDLRRLEDMALSIKLKS
jgi:translin